MKRFVTWLKTRALQCGTFLDSKLVAGAEVEVLLLEVVEILRLGVVVVVAAGYV